MAGVGEEGRTDDVMREDHGGGRANGDSAHLCFLPLGSSCAALAVFSFILTPILIYRCILLVQKLLTQWVNVPVLVCIYLIVRCLID